MSEHPEPTDGQLVSRLRQLGLVDLDALVAGTGEDGAAIVAAYAADLTDALAAASDRMRALSAGFGTGAHPLALVQLPAERRRGEAAREAIGRARAQLESRAAAHRELAVLSEVSAMLLLRLSEVDSRLSQGADL